MINKPKMSIVIPVYNAEKYIEQCLKSCINQTMKDIEIILVNDESTDNTLEILNRYSEKDKRIIVINQKNTGPGLARNRGLDIAKGEYVFFVDSDDFFEKNLCEETYNCAVKNNADAVLFNYKHYDTDGKTLLEKYNVKKDLYDKFNSNIIPNSFNDLETIKNAVFNVDCAAWKYILKKEFLIANNIRFPNIRPAGEDMPFTLEVKLSAKIFYLDKKPFYSHRVNINDSVSKNPIPWDVIVKEYFTILKKYNKLDCLKQEYKKCCSRVLFCIQEDKREEFLNSLETFLNDDLFSSIKNQIFMEDLKRSIKQELYYELKQDLKLTPAKIIRSIFSVKNEYSYNKKYKVITILGIKAKFRINKPS